MREPRPIVSPRAQYHDAHVELHQGNCSLQTISPNLHVNILLRIPGHATIVAEVQIYHSAILEVKKESHKLYDVTRATSIDALHVR